jgi:hypothetical protein
MITANYELVPRWVTYPTGRSLIAQKRVFFTGKTKVEEYSPILPSRNHMSATWSRYKAKRTLYEIIEPVLIDSEENAKKLNEVAKKCELETEYRQKAKNSRGYGEGRYQGD